LKAAKTCIIKKAGILIQAITEEGRNCHSGIAWPDTGSPEDGWHLYMPKHLISPQLKSGGWLCYMQVT